MTKIKQGSPSKLVTNDLPATNKYSVLGGDKYFLAVCDTSSIYLLHNFVLKSFISSSWR